MQSGFNHSRYDQRSKKRKSNLILNGLIGVVVLLIGFVSASIFLGNDESTSTKEKNSVENKDTSEHSTDQTTEDDTSDNNESEENATATDDSEDQNNEESNSENVESDSETAGESSEENDSTTEEVEVVTEGSDDPNVLKTIVNPSWEPIGTTQTGEHVNVYGGVDWDEMVKAISYATDIPVDNMTVHFLGNNGHNKSVGTVYPKGKENIYRVYIEWVDGQGWKPTKVEELAEIVEEDTDSEAETEVE